MIILPCARDLCFLRAAAVRRARLWPTLAEAPEWASIGCKAKETTSVLSVTA